MTEALHWRAQTDPDHVLFVLLNAKVSNQAIHKLKNTVCMHVMLHMRVIIPVLQGVAVSTATCVQLHKRAEKIAAALTEKGSINTGENVVLLYPPGGLRLMSPVCVLVLQTGVFLTPLLSSIFFSGIDLIAAFYGCLYAGCVPVNVRPPHPQNLAATLPTVRMIIDVSVFF